jgi:hypothetical protein
MAEREGFEPSVEFPLHTLSKRAPSTTRPSLRFRINDLRAACIRIAQNHPSRISDSTSCSVAISWLGACEIVDDESCQTFDDDRSLPAISFELAG